MASLSHEDMVSLLVALAVLLGVARGLGELFTRMQQPAVIGELIAGIVLGPTVLGMVWPALQQGLFPQTPGFNIALDALTGVAIVLFLLVAGLEVDLSAVWRQGRAALCVGSMGMLVPFALGFSAAWYLPVFQGEAPHANHFVFSLFIATALSISALPVIAKILMDLGLFRTDVGMVVIAAAMLNDVVGWIIFAVVLGMFSGSQNHMDLGSTVVLLFLFTGLILTLGRRLLDYVLPWIHAHTSWPGGVLGFTLVGALLCAAFTEWIGIHAIFGAFLFGIALGDSRHLRGRTRRTLEQFISFIFAPLFFASVGLRVNFVENFDLVLVLLILVLATAGKLLGCGLGAWLSGMGRRESWAVGCALNARGAMEIILGLVALEVGVIDEPIFVALVIMALITSMSGATLMQRILHLKKPRRFFQFMPGRGFLPGLRATQRREAILELAEHLAPLSPFSLELIAERVWQRERIMSTNVGSGVALPHARIQGLKAPLIAVGTSRDGVDFEGGDGEPVHLIFLVLSPWEDPDLQVEILADIARSFQQPDLLGKVLEASTATEFLSLVKTQDTREDPDTRGQLSSGDGGE